MSLFISSLVSMFCSMSRGIAFHLLLSLICAGRYSLLSAFFMMVLIRFWSSITVLMSIPDLFFPLAMV